MRNKKMAVPYDKKRAQLAEFELILQQMYWYNLFEHSRFFYNLKVKSEKVVEGWGNLKLKASNLSIRFQMAFWAFVSRQAKQLIESDSSMFYEVISQTTPNPLSAPEMFQLAGAGSIIMRSVRILLIPLQKLLQYAYWKTSPPGSNAKKPTFTRKDALYLGLDLLLLGLTIAAFAAGAGVPAAAIAVTAAAIAGTVAAVQYGKFLYDGYQMKKEKLQVDTLLEKLRKDPAALLNENEQKLIEDQRNKLGDDANKNNYSPVEVLEKRSAKLESDINKTIADRYTLARKTLSTALTVMGIVAAALILGGLMLGPAGFPVVAAGVALSITAGVIALGMTIANYIKKGRDNAQSAIGKKDFYNEIEPADKNKDRPDLSDRKSIANDPVYAAAPVVKAESAALITLPAASSDIHRVSIFHQPDGKTPAPAKNLSPSDTDSDSLKPNK